LNKIRVLVADDSIFMRRVLSDAINNEIDLEVVGVAANGEEVLPKVLELKPDVVSLDIEMPKKNGLVALKEIMTECPTPVVMCSTLTAAGTAATIHALELGASDFIPKPQAITQDSLAQAFKELLPKLRVASRTRPRAKVSTAQTNRMQAVESEKVLLIAASTGGPKALMTLFESLPKGMKVPALIVQHMPRGFTESFSQRLSNVGAFKVMEGFEGAKLTPGVAYVAPGGLHMALKNSKEIQLLDTAERLGVKPCADILFESAAQHLREKCVVAVLTGMGRDGHDGCKALKGAGAQIFVESESSCTVYGMPKAVKDAGLSHGEFSIDQIGVALCGALSGGKRAAA
jgi:two-component system chemotaxis response regulator CheB